MAIEQTLSIIKPDGVAKNLIGEIYRRFEEAGLKIVAAQMQHLTRNEAEGPVMIQVLEGENAIAKNRDLMGATNPANAAPGTIRADFAKTVDENIVHGSDGLETAKTEIEFFFSDAVKICPRTR
jgi:nucleoside-diphosphate kinase